MKCVGFSFHKNVNSSLKISENTDFSSYIIRFSCSYATTTAKTLEIPFHSMNKAELINLVSEKAEISKKDADAIVSATVESIMESVAGGEKVSLVGFGSFEPRERKARNGRNPQTGKTIQIPATTVPAFSAGKGFKELVAAK